MASNYHSGSSQQSPYSDPEASCSSFADLGGDEDMPRRGESKRKRFHPFRAVRNIFRRNKRQGVEEDSTASKKSRSTSELSTVHVPGDVPQFEVLAPPYAAGLSVSHDSIFSSEHNASALDPENSQPIPASALSVQHVVGLKRFKDELFTRVRARRDSDDDDIGLPHSPCTSPTTADVLAQGLKDKPCHSRSSYSAGSLISMGSSENDEDSGGIMSSSHSSRMSLSERRTLDFDGEFDVSQPVPLNHNAALHKISVRPKRTHGLPRHRKLQQIAAAAVAVLPATPEVTEDQLGLKTPSTHSEEDRPLEIPLVEEKIINKEENIAYDNDSIEEEHIYDSVMDDEPEVQVESVPVPEETIALVPSPPASPELIPVPVDVPVPEEVTTPTPPREPSPVKNVEVVDEVYEEIQPSLEEELPLEDDVAAAPKEVVSPPVSRGATPDSLEGKILSKSKSTAAELKLRHEIKQFSKRQKELKELKAKGDEEEVIEVKECTKSLEITEKKEVSKSPVKEVIEEDMTVVSAETFFTPIDRSTYNYRPSDNKVYKPISLQPKPETEEPKEVKVKNKGHVFTVNDINIPTENEEKFTSTILVSNTSDDQRTEMSVITSSDLSHLLPGERPPRRKQETEVKNRVTSGLVTVESQSFSECGTLKLESDFLREAEVTSDVQEELEEVKDANEDITRTIDVENGPMEADDKDADGEPPLEAAKNETTEPEVEKPKVVMRKHDAKNANRNSCDSPAFSSLDFEGIMKQRRSITENDVIAQKVVSEEVGTRSPEVKANNGKRLSVEIVPYNTRVKESGYLSSTPPKTAPAEVTYDKPQEVTSDIQPEMVRKLSFSKLETATSASNEDLVAKNQPVQFRIRRGKSLNEKSDTFQTRESPEKPKIPRPKSQLGLAKEKPPVNDKPVIPEFMKIQLRSSKEELDAKNDNGSSTPPKNTSPVPTGAVAVPQWEVKIGQPKFPRKSSLGPSSLPVTDDKKEADKPKEKVAEKPQRVELNVENKENMGSTNVQVKEDKNEDAMNSSSEEESKFSRSSGSMKEEGRRKSQGFLGGSGIDAEPELFRVFARRSIKQRKPKEEGDKPQPEAPPTNKPEVNDSKPEKVPLWKVKSQEKLEVEKGPATKELKNIQPSKEVKNIQPNKEVKNVPLTNKEVKNPIQKEVKNVQPITKEVKVALPITKEVKVAQPIAKEVKVAQPIAKEVKVALPIAKEVKVALPIAKEVKVAQPIAKEVKVAQPIAKEVKVIQPIAKEVKVQPITKEAKTTSNQERSNSPQRPRFRAKSLLANDNPIPPRERKTSVPTESPSSLPKLTESKKQQNEVRETNSKNSKVNLPQLTVSIKHQQEMPARKSSLPTSPPIIKNSQPDLLDSSNDSNNKDGSTPGWMQLAQQRREQREQKERKLYGSSSNTFVLDTSNGGRPSRNSKVLDLVNNFQKLQTT